MKSQGWSDCRQEESGLQPFCGCDQARTGLWPVRKGSFIRRKQMAVEEQLKAEGSL